MHFWELLPLQHCIWARKGFLFLWDNSVKCISLNRFTGWPSQAHVPPGLKKRNGFLINIALCLIKLLHLHDGVPSHRSYRGHSLNWIIFLWKKAKTGVQFWHYTFKYGFFNNTIICKADGSSRQAELSSVKCSSTHTQSHWKFRCFFFQCTLQANLDQWILMSHLLFITHKKSFTKQQQQQLHLTSDLHLQIYLQISNKNQRGQWRRFPWDVMRKKDWQTQNRAHLLLDQLRFAP